MEGLCPGCGAMVSLSEDTIVSEIIDCPECGASLEVMSINPVQLDSAPEEEEDWGE